MVTADRARYDLDQVAKERLAALHRDDGLYEGVQKAYAEEQAGVKARRLSEVLAALAD